jgi:hypothetical protein
VTDHPTAESVVQQLREAFEAGPYRYAIFDRDPTFGEEVVTFLEATGLKAKRLIREYVNYHQEDRIHDSLSKDTPTCRPFEPKPSAKATVISMPPPGRTAS